MPIFAFYKASSSPKVSRWNSSNGKSSSVLIAFEINYLMMSLEKKF